MPYTIYRATNEVNGKVYIGFDSNWPVRKRNHLANCENPNLTRTYNSKFYRALRKYGREAFRWEVIYQHWDGKYTLQVMEPLFIRQYDSYRKGYNSTMGGEGQLNMVFSETHKKKIGNANRGKTRGAKQWLVWKIDNPLATTIITNMSKFCKENQLLTGHMSSLAHGSNPQRTHHKGWCCKKIS